MNDSRLEQLSADVARLHQSLKRQRLVLGCLALVACALALVGWGQATPPSLKANQFQVIDAQGKVRATIEPGLIALYNSQGKPKARITCDENNGNLVMNGEKDKRLEVFMDSETPRVVLYGPSGNPVMVLPPAD